MISLSAHKAAAESVDSVNGVDLSAALAYIATAEGTAATIAERACDRAGLDYATCPAEILDAAERRAAELARQEAVEIVGGYLPEVLRSRELSKAANDCAAKKPYRGQAEDVRRCKRAASNIGASCLGGVVARLQRARPDLEGRALIDEAERLIALV